MLAPAAAQLPDVTLAQPCQVEVVSSPPGKTNLLLFYFYYAFHGFIPVKAQAGASLSPGQVPRPCIGASHAPLPAQAARAPLSSPVLSPPLLRWLITAALPARMREVLDGHSVTQPEQIMQAASFPAPSQHAPVSFIHTLYPSLRHQARQQGEHHASRKEQSSTGLRTPSGAGPTPPGEGSGITAPTRHRSHLVMMIHCGLMSPSAE